MTNIRKVLILAVLFVTLSSQSYAADIEASNNSNNLTEDHRLLKVMLNDSIDAINKKDLSRLTDFLDEN